MPSPLPPQAPRSHLPSRRTGAILAAFMLAAGIALGVLLGPGPVASLASSARAQAIARTLALLALDGVDAGGGRPPGAIQASAATQPSSGASAGAHATGSARAGASAHAGPTSAASLTAGQDGKAGAGASHGAAGSPSVRSSSPGTNAPSPTPKSTQSPGTSSETETKGAPLPPIARVWLIVLPYGQGFANVQAQPSAAPYLDGQLLSQGTLLSAYSALAGSQLAGAATLLSGQVAAGVTVLSPPACTAAPAAGTTGPQGAGTPAVTTGTTSPPGAGTVSSPSCPAGEPAGLQAADTYVREVVSRLVATAGYREHGLIAITFAASVAANDETAYPAGTQTTTLANAGTPPGVLLLSPFLAAAGRHLSSTFDAAAPRRSLEEVLTKPKDPPTKPKDP